ncbi:DNA internalization-related competence protein ComEC/Rec2 [Lysobacter brunescens]|uniref:DNA internalization-related competence protein ComEC/Rec2 n=1 Tax=Lysobacter brunescens TaxID=262323 RepID=A0ABW2YIR5_9GAMM
MSILSASAWLLAGIGLCLCLPAPPDAVLLSMIAALAVVSLLRTHWRPFAVLCAGMLLAGLHASWSLSSQLPVSMEHGVFLLRGTVSGMPIHEARRTRFEFLVDDVDAMPEALRGARLRLAWYDDFDVETPPPDAPRLRLAAGSRWVLSAKLRAPRGLRNPGSVDGEKHAFVDRIVAGGYVRAPETARQLRGPRGIDAWREAMSRRIERAVPDASSRFLRALALGDTRGLDDEDWSVLRANGLTHLIAISGFHVGLVAGFFALMASATWWLFPLLGRVAPRVQASALAALAGAAIYAAMAGFALPTVRTLLMIAVVAIARLSRRAWRPWSAVAMSVVAMLVVDPLAVLTAGFWLSFGGVVWLLWCLPDGGGSPVRDFLSAQAVATVGLLPLTVALFGQASLAGPFANLLAIPWWSLVVVPLSLVGLALEALHAGWGAWPWRLAAWAFDPSWSLFETMAGSPLALWWLPEARWYALPLALLSAFWCLLPRALPGKPLALLLWLPLLWPDRQAPDPGEVEVVVLDVGQGLSVLVRTANHHLLYDMGPAIPEGFDAGERAVVPALHALGVRALDAAVVSHGDNDHAGGFESVAAVFPMRWVFAPEGSNRPAAVPGLRQCRAGDAWTWDGVRFRVLHPTPHFPYLRNESSCVLRIETAHRAVLLTGDIGHVIERGLLRHDPAAVRAEVVLMAHHGSDGSSDPGFVAATGARFAPVSAGYGNRFRHPKPAVVERWRYRGARTPLTAETGAQRLRLTAAGIAYEDERTRRRRLWDAVARRARAE